LRAKSIKPSVKFCLKEPERDNMMNKETAQSMIQKTRWQRKGVGKNTIITATFSDKVAAARAEEATKFVRDHELPSVMIEGKRGVQLISSGLSIEIGGEAMLAAMVNYGADFTGVAEYQTSSQQRSS
jgi:hypothetical protein